MCADSVPKDMNIIRGPILSGKTTLALWLKELLESATRLPVAVHDKDVTPEMTLQDLARPRGVGTQGHVLNVLEDKVQITIHVEQTVHKEG